MMSEINVRPVLITKVLIAGNLSCPFAAPLDNV